MKHSHRSLQSLSASRSGLLALAVAVVVAALGFGLNVLLVREGVPRRDLLLASSSILGGVAGWVLYQFLRSQRNKQEMLQRMRTIAELNHHIRNALQVIRYAGGSRTTQDASQLQLINEAVASIDWALCEVLPQYSVGPMMGEASRNQADSRNPIFSSAVVDDFVLRHKETHPH